MTTTLKQFWKKYHLEILFSLLLAAFVLYPYLISNLVDMEHDTFFHLSRIEGLARSIQDGQWLPRIYPYKNMEFGYASPLFYSDFFLYIPALLYNLGMPLTSCYKLVLFFSGFFSCFFMMLLVHRLSKQPYAPFLAGALYLFANYRLTDVYVRGAMGEVMAFVFLPLVLIGIYDVLENPKHPYHYLVLGFGGLILCHNISFILACIVFAGFLLFYLKSILAQPKAILLPILKAVGWVVGLTAFFTFPMLEQLVSQPFYLHSYAQSSDLPAYTVNAWGYFAFQTVYGLGSSTTAPNETMLANLGYLIPLLPFTGLFVLDKPKDASHHFLLGATLLGYICFLLPWSGFPWKYLSFIRIIQFPWRFMGVALVLLCLPASIYVFELIKKDKFQRLCTGFLLAAIFIVGAWHLYPAFQRPTQMTSAMTWQDILDGKLIDPNYSAFYVRVEVAGADYLPEGSPDFRVQTRDITDANGTILSTDHTRKGTTFHFTVSAQEQTVVLPITYYKGYQVFAQENGSWVALPTTSTNTLVSFVATSATEYECRYTGTWIQTLSFWLSLATLVGLVVVSRIKKKPPVEIEQSTKKKGRV